METEGQRLKRLRKKLRWSQQTLADQAGCSQGTIGNIESGARGYGESVVGIAKALNVSPEYLLLKTNDLQEPPMPSGDFEERAPFGLSDSEWAAIQDLRSMSDNRRGEFMEAMRREAIDARSIADRAIQAMKRLSRSIKPK